MKTQLNEYKRLQQLACILDENKDINDLTTELEDENSKTIEVATTTQLGDKLINVGKDIKAGKIKQMDRTEIISFSQLIDNILNKAQKGSLGTAIRNTDKTFTSNTKSVKP